MADGRSILAEMMETLEINKAALLEKIPGSENAVNEILQGFEASQKKFYMKTQGGTDKASGCQTALNELIAELSGNGLDLAAKFEKFTAVSKETIHLAITTVIRMT